MFICYANLHYEDVCYKLFLNFNLFTFNFKFWIIAKEISLLWKKSGNKYV